MPTTATPTGRNAPCSLIIWTASSRRRIEIISADLAIDEDQRCANKGHRFGGSCEGQGRQEHRVARPDIHGHQRQHNGVCTALAADRNLPPQ